MFFAALQVIAKDAALFGGSGVCALEVMVVGKAATKAIREMAANLGPVIPIKPVPLMAQRWNSNS